MPQLNYNLLQKYETCVLRHTPEDSRIGIVKRSGSDLRAGERGNFDSIVGALGQSGWSLRGISQDANGEFWLFERALPIPGK